MAWKINLRKIISTAIILLLLIFIYTQIASRILFTPIDFDEGYNLQISKHLSKNLLDYSTYNAKFDPYITTGPALLIPAAFFISNFYPLVPRIVMLLFVIAFIHICHLYIHKNIMQKMLFLIVLTITPLFYFFSSHILGELPGFTLFLISLIILDRKKYFWSGVFLGLSILTKQIYAFGSLAVILQFMLIHIFSKNQRTTIFRNLALMVSGVFVVLLSWYIYIFFSVGFSYYNFKLVLHEYWRVAQILSQPKLSLIDKRIEMLGYVFGVNGFLLLLFLIALVKYIFNNLRDNHIVVSLSFFIIIYTSYFLLFGSTNWYRHLFPAVLAVSVCLPLTIDGILNSRNYKNLVVFVVIILICIGNILYFNKFLAKSYASKKMIEQNLIFKDEKIWPYTQEAPLLASQFQTSLFVRNLPPENELYGFYWWSAPEIEYLSGRHIFRNESQKTRYLIRHFYGDLLSNNNFYLDQIKNKKVIYQSEGYTIYKINDIN